MKKILVTGGTGYIGSHTVVELVQAGYEVVIIDDLSNSSRDVLTRIEKICGYRAEFHQFDLCDLEKLTAFKANHSISGIIHFAAFKAVGESVEQPLSYYKNNLLSLVNLLEVFGNTAKFVFSSSCTVYGEPDDLPVTEASPIKKAVSPYGNTKQIGEEILYDVASADTAFKTIALRYFNPVGAHASGLIGEFPSGIPQNLVPYITRSAIGSLGAITVHGNDYNTPDGSAIRDYIHVTDVAKAHVAAIKRLEGAEAADNFEVFNIGTGRGYSVLEIIDTFQKETGVKLNYTIGPRRAGDIEQVYGDVKQSNDNLQWKAALDLRDMLVSAWQWQQNIEKESEAYNFTKS